MVVVGRRSGPSRQYSSVGFEESKAPFAPKHVGPWLWLTTPEGRSFWLQQHIGSARWTLEVATLSDPMAAYSEQTDAQRLEVMPKRRLPKS